MGYPTLPLSLTRTLSCRTHSADSKWGTPPTLTFVGLLGTRPNRDAAEWFITDILPLVRRRIPDVEVRIVGEGGHEIEALGDDPGVTVTGHVARIEDELIRADASIVPIRFGGGTRLKILEAWSHRIPVVTTSIGAAGLDAEHETHTLIADGARDFADACVRVLTDPAVRATLADGGARRASLASSRPRGRGSGRQARGQRCRDRRYPAGARPQPVGRLDASASSTSRSAECSTAASATTRPSWSRITRSQTSSVLGRCEMMTTKARLDGPVDRTLDPLLGLRIERARGLVEHEQARGADQGTGDPEPLELPAREVAPCLAELRVVPVG